MVAKEAPVPPRRSRRLQRPRLSSIMSLRRDSDFLDGILGWGRRRPRDRDRGRRRRRDADRDSAFRWPQVGVVNITGSGGDGGGGFCRSCLSACCCCGCCCCCLNLEYVRTLPGMLRLAQMTLSWLCNWLVGRYALRVAGTLGSAMPAFFLASAGGALGCSLLLAVALLSAKSVILLRASLFEMAFHATAVGLYATQASYLHVATSIYLEPYKNDLETYTYPAIVTSYWLGYFLAALHSLDTVYALKHYGWSCC